MFKNSYFRMAVFALLLTAAVAVAGGIKTWSNGDTLSASDLNANFQHIHSLMVGGHGARLVDADVSASANIGYTKLQNGRGIARAWGRTSGTCTVAGSCIIDSKLNLTSIVRTASTGVYTVTLSYTATNTSYMAIANSETSARLCHAVPISTTTITINCENPATAAAADATFSFVVFDDN